MAEFKLERFKYSWKGNWAGATDYKRDDIVKVGGKSYVCLVTHTSDADFNTDLEATVPGSNPPIPAPKWTVMTDSRSFVGSWATATAYQRGDIVEFDGSLWACVTGHTSSDFATDYDNWEVFAKHIEFKANWAPSTGYGPGALVKYNGIVYKCVNPHTSTGSLTDNQDDWEVFYEGVEYTGVMQTETTYRVNDLFKFGGSIFKTNEEFITNAGGTFDDTKADLLLPGFQFDGDWDNTTAYGVGDVVRYGGFMYYCTNNNVATDPFVRDEDSSNFWQQLVLTYNFRGTWSETANYRPGDIVQRGGDLFLAKYEVGGDETDGSSADYLDEDVWELLVPSLEFAYESASERAGTSSGTTVNYTVEFSTARGSDIGNKYVIKQEYRPDLVMYSGYTYVFDQSSNDNAYFPNEVDGVSFNPHPLNFSNDNENGVLGGGTAYLNGVSYYLDDVQVDYAVYNNTDDFTAATARRVEIEVTDATPTTLYYWCYNHVNMGATITTQQEPVITGAWQENTEYKRGEVVYYLGTAYKANIQHVSAANNFPGDNGSGYDYWDIVVERGSAAGLLNKGDLLTYNLDRTLQGDESSFGPTALPIGQERQVLSVNTSDEAFWRNYLHDTDTIYVGQNGMDLEGYGLSPNRPFATVKHACEYIEENFAALTPTKVYVATGNYIETGPISIPAGCVVMGDELRSTKITANDPLDDYKDNDYITKKLYVQHIQSFIDDLLKNRLVTVTAGNNVVQDRSVPGLLSDDPTNTIVDLIIDHDDYLDYWLGSGTEDPDVVSTNTLTSDADYIDAALILNNNRNFIANEVFAYLDTTQTDYTYDRNRIRRDVYHLLQAIRYDLRYTGNYKTLLHTRDFKNKALGSQFDDLFYVRDTTGVRNCTINGLRGTLNPPGVFDLYQRPTGGACVSLDPGWGPDDERVWINTRSPYIQGVTNIGSNCVGQKIDGSLHNGGYKSCTSNDFTQVLSDGIGAWVTNGGRAELVSVFTYYCAIGYLADEGGVIRSTNGNNSYGAFGAIADGYDPTETPQDVTVDNKSENEAIVESVFAGEFTDQIFAFQYEHCGEGYTTASATIIGSGANADVEFTDFRDGALSNIRLLNSNGSGSVGGAGYTNYNGNAQTGGTTTITLDTGSGFDEDEVINQRIIIVSGDGTGQYGYIQAYDAGTKIATVYKDSTDTAGWDHIVPGTTIETLLTTNTQYRIEPRVTVEAPPTSSSEANLPQVRPYADLAFSDTTSSYTDFDFDPGTGTTDGVLSSQATFDITRVAQTYTVTMTDFGVGYAVGDQTTVSGADLGGVTPDNDCVITVTSTTDDSSNSIATFSVSGTGIAGKFVAIADPNFSAYSSDGNSWTETNLPFVNTWKKIVAGNNRFIALPTETSDQFALSLDGIEWSRLNVGLEQDYTDIAYTHGRFVAIAQNSNTVVYSTDGETWSQGTIPDDALGDSTASEWLRVSYGAGKWVAVSGNDSASAVSTDGGANWTRYTGLPAGSNDWVSLKWGRDKFVLINEGGQVYYSFDGQTWTSGGDLPSQDGSTAMNWTDMKYENGLFIAICNTSGLVIGADQATGSTNFFVTSDDGINWTSRTFPSDKLWGNITYGQSKYVALSQNATLNGVGIINMGATAKLRADIGSNAFDTVRIWDPGSGYDSANPPELTIVAEGFTAELATQQRISDGALSQPAFINAGIGYRSSTTTVTITGDGTADIFPVGNEVVVTGVSQIPGPGAQLRFADILDEETELILDDLKLFAAVKIEDLGDDGLGTNTNKVKFTISPGIDVADNLSHGSNLQIRTRYSQCRVSGHDFLDIGTGNFEETNYPEIYAGGNFFTAAPENEVYEENGGRVFYTSSDQDGNFRAGELFSVQQATGVVTISAEFFNLDGLSELALGGVRLGGSGAVVREFSTDVNFTEDSNNVVPTQRAVVTFLANRLSEGGSELETNQLTAGRVVLGSELNKIDHSLGGVVEIPVLAKFEGSGEPLNGTEQTQVMGLMQAYPLYFRRTDDSVQ